MIIVLTKEENNEGEISLSEAIDKLLEAKKYGLIIFLCEGKAA
jgi:predicted CopG family antitoxin